MVTANLQFTQNAVSPGPGVSMVGVAGLPVTVESIANGGGSTFIFDLLDAPLDSALTPGILSSGSSTSTSFTPDNPATPGCYRIRLTVVSPTGARATTIRNFAVPTTQGWILPPFRANAAELNFPGNVEGWESLINRALIDVSVGVTDEKVKASIADTTPSYLNVKMDAGDGLLPTILNPGANEAYRLDVGANVDGSITVNSNDIQVGVLASDTQHGARGGGTQHAVAISGGSAGFMSGADKLKLDTLGNIARTLTVGLSGAVDYTSVASAINAAVLGGATATTPWLIEIFPGTYTEAPMTLPSGVFLIGQTANGRTAVIEASNPNADLMTCTGGGMLGLRFQGVTNPANALIRCATPFSQVQCIECSVRNCSTGLAISAGATVVTFGFTIVISGAGQRVITGLSMTGATSTLVMNGGSFNVPPPFLALYPGVNPIETCISIAQGRATLSFVSFSAAYNTTAAIGLLADDGAQISLFSSVALNNANAIVVGSVGANTQVVVQGAEFRGNFKNGVNNSATGTIFISAAADSINYAGVPGSKLSGIVQSFTADDTLLVGGMKYVYTTDKRVVVGEYIHDFAMTGVTDGGVVTDAGGLTVDVTAGQGYASSHSPDHDLESVVWTAAAGVSLTASSTNYVFYDTSAGVVATAIAAPGVDDIVLAVVITSGVAIRYLHQVRNSTHQQDYDLYQYLVTTRKIAWVSGLATTQGSTARKLDVASGSWYRALDLLSVAGGSDVSWSYYYGPGAASEQAGVSDLSITQYDNAGVLTAMTGSYYRADTVIITSDNRVSVIYGSAEFSTQAAAEATTNVAAMPNFLDPTGCRSALVVVQQGVGIASIVDIRPDPNAATASGGGGAGVSVHAALSGLSADDHLQYLRTDGTRIMTGSLNMGTNSITNVNLVDGIDVTTHAVRHQPGGADAIATANPVTIGTANAGGSATSFTRSDHVHAHGAQTDGTLHAVAIASSTNGFLSGTDKAKLDGLITNAVPDTRNLTAGAGMTGGGDLSADRTFNVIANADGSITVNADDIQVGVLASDAQHGARGGGTQHDAATTSVNGFMSGSDKTKLDGLPSSAVPTTRTLTAGAGMTGGGDLSANRTFNVIANADGSITVNADDIQVGVLASDAQHGNRGGGTIHPVAISGGAAGFMSGGDKLKLDGIAASAAALTSSVPVNVTKAAAAVGVGTLAARDDHKHDVSTAAPGATGVATASGEGSATTLARSDHSHQSNTAPASVTKAAAAVGTSGEPARADHKHDVTTAAPGATGVATASGEGSATTLARSDHSHQSNTAPANVTKAAAAIGTSGQPARADHKHDVTTATASAQAPGDAAAEGAATSLARSDHKHSLPAFGSIAGTFCQGNDSRLSDARTPTAHATTHQSGGSDSIKLDDFATPDDNTDLNASTARHGLLPKLAGGSTTYLRADGTWSAPPAGDVTAALNLTDEYLVRGDGGAKGVQTSLVKVTDAGYVGVDVTPDTQTGLTAKSFGASTYGVNVGTTVKYNDLSITPYGSIQFHSANQIFGLSGCADTADGKFLDITNLSTYDLLISHEDASSSASHRFACPNGQFITVPPGGGVRFQWSPTSNRWQCVSDVDAFSSGRFAQFSVLPLKATPVAADVLVIEDSATSYIKKRIAFSSIGAVFGANYQRQEALGETTTTGENQTKVTLVTGSLTGTFRVGWGAHMMSNNKQSVADLYDSTAAAVLMTMQCEPEKDNFDWVYVGGVVHVTLSASTKTLLLRYGNKSGSSDTIYMKNAWLEFWRVS